VADEGSGGKDAELLQQPREDDTDDCHCEVDEQRFNDLFHKPPLPLDKWQPSCVLKVGTPRNGDLKVA
jgi:hypothetical protein